MVDLNRPIYLMIEDIARVELEFPSTDAEFPVITLTEINNADILNFDNKEYGSDVTFQIDVWDNGDTREKCEEIASKVSERLTQNSFVRTSARGFKDENGLQRKTMKFNIKILEL